MPDPQDPQSLGLQHVKVLALSVTDPARAAAFYGKTLGLPPVYEGGVRVGYQLGPTTLWLKDARDWHAPPTELLNPRITVAADDAHATERELRGRGVRIPDPVARYDDFWIGSFLDSEGNKFWFCSPVGGSGADSPPT